MKDKIFENFEDIKILNSALPELTDHFEKLVRDYIVNAYVRSVNARKHCNGINIIEKIKEVEKADRLEHVSNVANLEKWRSKIYLGWVKQAHISTSAYLISNILSGDFFSIQGRTSEDTENAEKMSKVIKYLFDTNFNFKKVLYQAIIQLVKKGNTVVKGFWQVIQTYLHDYEEQFDPITGESIGFKQVKNTVKTYNDVNIEYIDFEDFHFYPVTGDFNYATKIHRKLMTYDELMRLKDKYINLDKLEKYKKGTNEDDTSEIKIEIKEAWITNAFIGEEQLSNAIVTVANDEVVIEYRPMPIDYGFSPFLFAPFDAIEGSNLGKGLCFDALPLQYMANFLVNQIVDAQKLGTFPQTIIPDSEDERKFLSRPGAIIKYDKSLFEKNMLPQQMLQNLGNLPLSFDSLQVIKNEFDAMTVPEFIKGVRPQKDETATRDMIVQQGGETRLSLAAENFNELLLKPLIQLIYTLYRQRANLDSETRLKIARIAIPATVKEQIPQIDEMGNTVMDENGNALYEEIEREKTDDELLAELSDIIPMDKIDVTIDGYKTNISKQKQIQNINTLLQMLPMASPDVQQQINQMSILKNVLLLYDLDADDFIFPEDEAKQKIMENISNANNIELFKAQEQLKAQKQIEMMKARETMQGIEELKQEAMARGIPPEVLFAQLGQQQPQMPPNGVNQVNG